MKIRTNVKAGGECRDDLIEAIAKYCNCDDGSVAAAPAPAAAAAAPAAPAQSGGNNIAQAGKNLGNQWRKFGMSFIP